MEYFLRSNGQVSDRAIELTAMAVEGLSFSDISREMMRARKDAVITNSPLEVTLQTAIRDMVSALPMKTRKQIALRMSRANASQHEVNKWTGVHRSTIRSAQRKKNSNESDGD